MARNPYTYVRRTPLDLDQPCWIWTGSVNPGGYGSLIIDGSARYAHRVSYQLHVGPIPYRYEVDHLCHNDAVDRGVCEGGRSCMHRRCWNPSHLAAVSSKDNIRGGRSTKRCKRGHDLTNPANVYVHGVTGKRRCKVCDNASQRRRYHARRAAAGLTVVVAGLFLAQMGTNTEPRSGDGYRPVRPPVSLPAVP